MVGSDRSEESEGLSRTAAIRSFEAVVNQAGTSTRVLAGLVKS